MERLAVITGTEGAAEAHRQSLSGHHVAGQPVGTRII